jgi:hypothetical protein
VTSMRLILRLILCDVSDTVKLAYTENVRMMLKIGGRSSNLLSGAELGRGCYVAMIEPLKNQSGEMDTDHIQP